MRIAAYEIAAQITLRNCSKRGKGESQYICDFGEGRIQETSPVQFSCCHVQLCSMPGFPVHHQLLELAQIHVHRVGDSIQPSHLYCPLLLLPSTFPIIRLFSNESVLHIRWPSIGGSISASSQCSGLISFRIG